MAKKVCEDWATLLFNEEVTAIASNDDKLNENIQEVLEENNFRVEFSGLLEKYFALGTGVMVEFVSDGEVIIDYITGDMTIITSYRNQKVNGICTVNAFKQGEANVTHLTYHDFLKGVYTITQEVYTSEDDKQLGRAVPLERVFDSKIQEIVQFKTSTPHFQVFKPNIVNNFELENPLGISVFANSVTSLMAIDKKQDSFINEFDAARHRIFLPSDATKVQQEVDETTGDMKMVTYFDTEQMEYQSVPMNGQEGIKFYNAEIRTQQHIDALNRELQTLGFKCGLGTGYYSFDESGVYQNIDAVMSENSDLWSTKKKHEIVMIKGLRDMVKSIAYLLTGKELANDDIEVSVRDSLIINDEALYLKDLELVDRGAMSMWQILVKWQGMTEKEAKAQIEEANAGSMAELVFNDEITDDVDGEPLPEDVDDEDTE